eukprot:351489-Chlamydomonas_euryale.AAC.5
MGGRCKAAGRCRWSMTTSRGGAGGGQPPPLLGCDPSSNTGRAAPRRMDGCWSARTGAALRGRSTRPGSWETAEACGNSAQ